MILITTKLAAIVGMKSAYMFEMYAVVVHNSKADVLAVSESEAASSHAGSSLSPNQTTTNILLSLLASRVNH